MGGGGHVWFTSAHQANRPEPGPVDPQQCLVNARTHGDMEKAVTFKHLYEVLETQVLPVQRSCLGKGILGAGVETLCSRLRTKGQKASLAVVIGVPPEADPGAG